MGMAKVLTDDRHFSDLRQMPDRRQGSDRRREIRTAARPMSGTLCVAAGPPVDVQIRDVSRNGLGMTGFSRILVGSRVVVVCGHLTITGTVRHCRERLTGEHAIGIIITRIVDKTVGEEI
jgi:hypothetical protein